MEQHSSHKEMSSQPLGDLSKLPGEIRNMIYEELQPFLRRKPGCYVEITRKRIDHGSLGLLRTCRQLNREVTSYLYDKEVIHFYVDSGSRRYLEIENQHDVMWFSSNHRGLNEGSLYDIFSNLPYERLSGIKIYFNAPPEKHSTEDNKRELCQLSKNIRDIVRLLESTRSLPPLEIQLQSEDTEPDSLWTLADDSPKKTLIRRTHEKNYMVALLPFFTLQNITTVTISGGHLEKEATMLENVQLALERKIPVSQILGDKEYWDGSKIRDWIIPEWKAKTPYRWRAPVESSEWL